MEIIAVSKSVRIAPRKLRLIADAVKRLSLQDALDGLSVLSKRAAKPLEKTIKSAIANAKNNNKLQMEDLKIKSIEVMEAPSYKRYRPSTRGRVHPYKRRGSHVKVILTDNKSEYQNPKFETSSKTSKAQNTKESERRTTHGTKN